MNGKCLIQSQPRVPQTQLMVPNILRIYNITTTLHEQLNGQFMSKEKNDFFLYSLSPAMNLLNKPAFLNVGLTNIQVIHLPLNLHKCSSHLKQKNKLHIYGPVNFLTTIHLY